MMSDVEGPRGPWSRLHQGRDLSAPEGTPLSIDNVARMFRVSRLTLWFYERLGLIKRRKRFGKDLVYGWTDCDRLAFIIKARAAGLSVREVMPIIKGLEPTARIVPIKAARRQCLELIDQLDRRHQILRAALTELRYIDSQLRDRDALDPQ
jgi:DNA-binding transcriptional MerR regulator